MRAGVLLLLAVLVLHGSPAHAARGNSLRDHVLHGFEPPAEAALPAWQPLENYDESMDSARRLLAEYALNAADDYILPEHEGDEITKARLLMEQYALATAEEDYPEADANANDYEESMDAARRLLQDPAPSAAEVYIHPKHEGDAITLARLMLEQYGTEAAADDSFLADAIATVKNLDETHSQQAAELQAPVPDELPVDLQSPPAPGSSMLEQDTLAQAAAPAQAPSAVAPAPYLSHPTQQTPGAESHSQQAAAEVQAPVVDEVPDDLLSPPAAPAPGSSSSVLQQDTLTQDAATAQAPPADAPAPYRDHPTPQMPAAEAKVPDSSQSTPHLPPAQAPAPDPDHPTLQAMRRLLEEHILNATSAEAPGVDIMPAWEAITSTLVTTGALLGGHAVEAASALAEGAGALWSESEESSGLGTGRRLMQAGAVNVTHLREEAKQVLLASDSFGVVYSGGNFARAIFALLQPMVAAGQTGTINVDAAYLLNLSQLLAQFIAMLGDLLSKGARLSADGIAPI